MKYYVKSLPSSCFDCDCCHEKDYDSEYRICGEKFCGIENMEVDYYYDHNYENYVGRPNWCPLELLESYSGSLSEALKNYDLVECKITDEEFEKVLCEWKKLGYTDSEAKELIEVSKVYL